MRHIGEDGLYVNQYAASIPYHRHAYMDAKGNLYWTQDADHPADDRCPACATDKKKAEGKS